MTSRVRPIRTVRMVRDPVGDGIGVFCVTVSGEASYYTLREIPCDIGGRGFAVHKLGLGNVLHVRVASTYDSSCECLGFLRYGYCRHLQGLNALIAAARL